jgi:hypothetical protein
LFAGVALFALVLPSVLFQSESVIGLSIVGFDEGAGSVFVAEVVRLFVLIHLAVPLEILLVRQLIIHRLLVRLRRLVLPTLREEVVAEELVSFVEVVFAFAPELLEEVDVFNGSSDSFLFLFSLG